MNLNAILTTKGRDVRSMLNPNRPSRISNARSYFSPGTIDYDNRLDLPSVILKTLLRDSPFLSKSANHAVREMAENLFTRSSSVVKDFCPSRLHGCTDVRALKGWGPLSDKICRQTDMAAAGGVLYKNSTIFFGIEDEKSVRTKIFSNPEVLTDNWSRRVYIRNSGHSIRIALLVHKLQESRFPWAVKATVQRTLLQPNAMEIASGRVSIYVVAHQASEISQRDYKGASLCHSLSPFERSLQPLQLAIVDHSLPGYERMLSALIQLERAGRAVTFHTFLSQFLSFSAHDRRML